MSNDPPSIPIATVMRALRVMGLSPVDAKHIKSVYIANGSVVITRYRTRPDGGHIPISGVAAGGSATEITTIAIDLNEDKVESPNWVPGYENAPLEIDQEQSDRIFEPDNHPQNPGTQVNSEDFHLHTQGSETSVRWYPRG